MEATPKSSLSHQTIFSIETYLVGGAGPRVFGEAAATARRTRSIWRAGTPATSRSPTARIRTRRELFGAAELGGAVFNNGHQ